MTAQAQPLVVISFYDRRPIEPLVALLDSLDRHSAGADHERVLCVNAGGGPPIPAEVVARLDGLLVRPNDGMNIGAWDAAWRHWPDRSCYLFLQDECRAITDGWLSSYLRMLDDPRVGLVGEAFNPSWQAPWAELKQGPGRDMLPEHCVGGRAANRVDVYLHAMRRFGIEPGPVGTHLRALVWGLRGDVLASIGGFPVGRDYGECIAAEIGVSRAVEAAGLTLRQVGSLPFSVFRHREWNQDVAGGPFAHRPVQLQELQALRDEVQRLRTARPSFWSRALAALRSALAPRAGERR
jgi:hypothetical protein